MTLQDVSVTVEMNCKKNYSYVNITCRLNFDKPLPILQGTSRGWPVLRRPLEWHRHWWCPLQHRCCQGPWMKMKTGWRIWRRTSKPRLRACPRPSRRFARSSLHFSSEVSSPSSRGGSLPARSSALFLAYTSTSILCRTKWGVPVTSTCNATPTSSYVLFKAYLKTVKRGLFLQKHKNYRQISSCFWSVERGRVIAPFCNSILYVTSRLLVSVTQMYRWNWGLYHKASLPQSDSLGVAPFHQIKQWKSSLEEWWGWLLTGSVHVRLSNADL